MTIRTADARTDGFINVSVGRVDGRVYHEGYCRSDSNVATFTVTTTGAQTLTIASLGVSQATTVDWGDGSINVYTGTAQRTYNYAAAGTWIVTVQQPGNVTTFFVSDNKVTLNSRAVASMVNVTDFRAYTLKAGRFDSADVAAWRPTTFQLLSMPAGYGGTFDSADVAAWRPTTFYLYSMPAGYRGTFNSADVAAWRPTDFYLLSMPTGYGGTFNSADVVAWRPTDLALYSMPAGYGGTFDSADVAAWRPTVFRLLSMPIATFTITITANGFAAWSTGLNNFQMQSNSLSQAQVNAILWDLYQAAIVPRTATGGTINVGGTNAAPSGTYQAAASCPVTSGTPGKEVVHELLNDTCAVGYNKWTTVTYTA